MTRTEAITDALTLVKRIGLTETPAEELVTRCERIFDRMVKGWTVAGVAGQKWRRETILIPLRGAKVEYTMGAGGDVDMPRPVRALQCSMIEEDTGSAIPILFADEEEYEAIPDKVLVGLPEFACFTPSVPLAQVSVWPVPPVAAAPDPPGNEESGYILSLVVERAPLYGVEDLDFPDEWHDAIVWGLASEIGPGAGVPLSRQTTIDARATELLRSLMGTA